MEIPFFVTPAGLTSSIPTLPRAEQHKIKEAKTESELSSWLLLFCDSRGIQTHNLLIRSQMLYSVELGSLAAPHF